MPFKEGHTPWNKGGHHSKETRDKLRKKSIEQFKNSEHWNKGGTGGFKKGYVPWNKGKKLSKEVRLKMSKNSRGDKGNNWQGGLTEKNKTIRNGIEYRLWREAVFARDNWICQKTGEQGGKLVAHHIRNFSDNENLRFAIDNGITLSKKSHKEFHHIYGVKNNTKEQLEEFLNG